MVEKWTLLFEKINNNPNLIVLSLFFNCALLLDFHDIYTKNYYFLILLFSSVFLNFLNFKYWYTSIFSFLFTFCFYLYYFPRQANHCNLILFFDFFLILIFFKNIFNASEISFKKHQLTIKIAIICIYFYAGFHKLNYDFFNTQTSCSKHLLQKTLYFISGYDLEIPSIVTLFFAIVTLFIEIILPFGLLFKKTEKYVVVLCVFFHGFLGLSFFSDFSSFAAFLLIFCTINLTSISKKLALFIRIYIGFVLLSIVTELLVMKYKIIHNRFIFVSSLLFVIGWFNFFYYYLKHYNSGFTLSYISKKSIIFCVVFLSIWSLKTYLGFGNLANLTMFSNLTTEISRSNHLFINTKKTKLLNFEEDTVKIIAVCKDLKYEKLEGFLLPMVEFKYKIKEWTNHFEGKKLSATIVYNNKTFIIDDLKESIYNEQKWYYKYLYYRKIQTKESIECYW